jgi:hypothetical protein
MWQILPAVVTDPATIPKLVRWQLNVIIDLQTDLAMRYVQ